jgi:ABC-type uncharacterized transport system substrate-binding protein
MRGREVVNLLISVVAAWPLPAAAQSNGRVRVIGVLRDVSEEDDRRLGLIAALREGLRDLGYVEGENLRIETRYAGPRYAGEQFGRLKQFTTELVGLKVELIVTAGPGIEAAHAVTTTVQIVMAAGGDVVATGLALSLSHPGGNVRRNSPYWLGRERRDRARVQATRNHQAGSALADESGPYPAGTRRRSVLSSEWRQWGDSRRSRK